MMKDLSEGVESRSGSVLSCVHGDLLYSFIEPAPSSTLSLTVTHIPSHETKTVSLGGACTFNADLYQQLEINSSGDILLLHSPSEAYAILLKTSSSSAATFGYGVSLPALGCSDLLSCFHPYHQAVVVILASEGPLSTLFLVDLNSIRLLPGFDEERVVTTTPEVSHTPQQEKITLIGVEKDVSSIRFGPTTSADLNWEGLTLYLQQRGGGIKAVRPLAPRGMEITEEQYRKLFKTCDEGGKMWMLGGWSFDKAIGYTAKGQQGANPSLEPRQLVPQSVKAVHESTWSSMHEAVDLEVLPKPGGGVTLASLYADGQLDVHGCVTEKEADGRKGEPMFGIESYSSGVLPSVHRVKRLDVGDVNELRVHAARLFPSFLPSSSSSLAVFLPPYSSRVGSEAKSSVSVVYFSEEEKDNVFHYRIQALGKHQIEAAWIERSEATMGSSDLLFMTSERCLSRVSLLPPLVRADGKELEVKRVLPRAMMEETSFWNRISPELNPSVQMLRNYCESIESTPFRGVPSTRRDLEALLKWKIGRLAELQALHGRCVDVVKACQLAQASVLSEFQREHDGLTSAQKLKAMDESRLAAVKAASSEQFALDGRIEKVQAACSRLERMKENKFNSQLLVYEKELVEKIIPAVKEQRKKFIDLGGDLSAVNNEARWEEAQREKLPELEEMDSQICQLKKDIDALTSSRPI